MVTPGYSTAGAMVHGAGPSCDLEWHWVYQVDFKSCLVSITCQVLSADPMPFRASPILLALGTVHICGYKPNRLCGHSITFSISFPWISLSQSPILSHNLLSWIFPSTESRSVTPGTDAVTPWATSEHCSSPRPHRSAEHRRGQEEVSEESCCYIKDTPICCLDINVLHGLNVIKLHDGGNAWSKTAKRI